MLDADEGQRRRVPVVLQRATADAEDPADGLAGQQLGRLGLRSEQFAHAFAQLLDARFQRFPRGRFDDDIFHNGFISWGYSPALSGCSEANLRALFRAFYHPVTRRGTAFPRLPSSGNEPIHILRNLPIGDASVELGGGDGGVAHHAGDAFHRDPGLEGERAERMAPDVKR